MLEKSKLDMINNSINDLKPVNNKLISVYENGYIGKKVYDIELADGTVKRCEQITKNKGNGDAVVIIPCTSDGNFVMIVESRPNIDNGVAIEFPAGMIDENEDPLVAAKRELLEETGYEVNSISKLEWHYQDQGCSKAVITTYIAEGCKKIGEQKLDHDEKIKPIEMTYDEVLELVKNNEISDANTKIAFMEYTLRKNGIYNE